MSYTQLRASTPTARKEHRCELCNKKIAVGEKYSREVGINDNELHDEILHIDCWAIVHEYFDELTAYDLEMGVEYEVIWDWYTEREEERSRENA